MDTMTELITPEELAATWKVTKAWIYDQYQSGKLKGIKLGRKQLRFRPSDIEAYLSGGN